jgi:hypothetical protein
MNPYVEIFATAQPRQMTLEAEILFGNITISVLYRFINFKAVMAT